MTVDVNLILQLAILVVGLLSAYLVKKGLIDRKTVEDVKEIGGTMAGAIDKMKEFDPAAAKKLTDSIVESIGEKKPVLDAFLKKLNLNKPMK